MMFSESASRATKACHGGRWTAPCVTRRDGDGRGRRRRDPARNPKTKRFPRLAPSIRRAARGDTRAAAALLAAKSRGSGMTGGGDERRVG